jgi:4a-hydroxytetrahydrobiopterin dehydratase
MNHSALHCKKCVPYKRDEAPLDKKSALKLLQQLDEHWQLSDDSHRISCRFSFKNYYQTIAFVNAAAFVAHQENHHPDLNVTYQYCHVEYSTHAIGGLTLNDFICAAKLDRLKLES